MAASINMDPCLAAAEVEEELDLLSGTITAAFSLQIQAELLLAPPTPRHLLFPGSAPFSLPGSAPSARSLAWGSDQVGSALQVGACRSCTGPGAALGLCCHGGSV